MIKVQKFATLSLQDSTNRIVAISMRHKNMQPPKHKGLRVVYTKATATNPKITLKAIANTPGIKKAWLKIYLPILVEPV